MDQPKPSKKSKAEQAIKQLAMEYALLLAKPGDQSPTYIVKTQRHYVEIIQRVGFKQAEIEIHKARQIVRMLL